MSEEINQIKKEIARIEKIQDKSLRTQQHLAKLKMRLNYLKNENKKVVLKEDGKFHEIDEEL